MKTVLEYIPQVASGSHYTPVQLILPFHTPECCQGTAIPIPHNVILQNAVQLGRCPPAPGICLVGEAQLILHVVGNPLCKLGGQPLEGWVVLTVGGVVLAVDKTWLSQVVMRYPSLCKFYRAVLSCHMIS